MIRNMVRPVAALGVATLVAVAPPATSASAATTLRFYSKSIKTTVTDPAGKKISDSQAGAPGSRFINLANDYAGDHKKHDKSYIGSDHSVCTLLSRTQAFCDIEISIDRSMIVADGVILNLESHTQSVKITSGTGKYSKAQGTIKAVSIGETDNTDLTIKLT